MSSSTSDLSPRSTAPKPKSAAAFVRRTAQRVADITSFRLA